MESDSILLFLAVLGVSILALVALVLWFVARVLYQTTGLERMVSRFRALEEPAGLRFGNQTISVGAIRFRRCATAVIGPSGFYVKPWAVIPAVLIPWREIHTLHNTEVYRHPAVEFAVGSPVAGRISVLAELFAAVQPYLARAAHA